MDSTTSFVCIIFLFLSILPCQAEDVNYNIKTSVDRPLLPNDDVSMVVDAQERMEITQIQITTSSISIEWDFVPNGFNGTHRETVVGYISMSTNGRFISDNLGHLIKEFEFRHLQPDTAYSVCVELITESGVDRVSHFKCVGMRTIPTIRTDSVVAMIVTIGYLIFMGVVGCIIWRRRVHKNKRNRLEEEDIEEGSTVRWKDLEEQQQLNSIEATVGV